MHLFIIHLTTSFIQIKKTGKINKSWLMWIVIVVIFPHLNFLQLTSWYYRAVCRRLMAGVDRFELQVRIFKYVTQTSICLWDFTVLATSEDSYLIVKTCTSMCGNLKKGGGRVYELVSSGNALTVSPSFIELKTHLLKKAVGQLRSVKVTRLIHLTRLIQIAKLIHLIRLR